MRLRITWVPLLLTMILLLVAGAPAWGGTIVTGGGETDPEPDPDEDGDECNNPPCEHDPGGGVDNVLVPCPIVPGGIVSVLDCIEEGFEATGDYDATPISDGLQVLVIDGSEPECLGFSEGTGEITTVELAIDDSRRVAKIYKFVGLLAGPSEEGEGGAVHLTLNSQTFTIVTSMSMTVDDLNNAVWNAMNLRFFVFDHGDYWVAVREKDTFVGIRTVGLTTDDEGLTATHIEIQPRRAGNYSTDCGDPEWGQQSF